MASNKDEVTFIRYCMNEHALMPRISPGRHERERSLDKYERLCLSALEREYQNAVVEIARYSGEGVPPTSMDTLVYASLDGLDVEDVQEEEAVNILCDRMAIRFEEWLIPVNLVRVSKASTYYPDLNPVVIRWACVSGLIPGAHKYDGYWDVPLEALPRLQDTFNSAIEISNGPAPSVRVLVWEHLAETAEASLQENLNYLVISLDGFGLGFLSPTSSYFIVSCTGAKARVEIEHFVDVEEWSKSPWAYETYCEHLVQQASLLHIECTRNINHYGSTSRVDGVTLRFEETYVPGAGVRVLIDVIIAELIKLIDATQISVAGGPTWSVIHEENEHRFRKDILEPLLNTMEFRSVRYTHGNLHEHGRDFVMEYETRFHEIIYIGLQAKCGDITDRANSKIDELIQQVKDAFDVTYPKPEPDKPPSKVYVSYMIVAISGGFTPNAVEAIREKMSMRGFIRGNVFFWDKSKISALIAHYWGRSNE
ncbi:MAG: hypothetical protein U0X20_08070 [Caldilineaceae bacterium]